MVKWILSALPFFLYIIFLARYGTDTLAAYQIADNFASLVYMLPVSCSMALTILIATAVGAHDIPLARRYKTPCGVSFRDQKRILRHNQEPKAGTKSAPHRRMK